jgi:hypothetical protein
MMENQYSQENSMEREVEKLKGTIETVTGTEGALVKTLGNRGQSCAILDKIALVTFDNSLKSPVPRTFVKNFEDYAKLIKWTDQEKILAFSMLLKGASKVWYQKDVKEEDKKEWLVIRTLFLAKYDNTVNAFLEESNFNNIVQGPKDTVVEHANRLQIAAARLKEPPNMCREFMRSVRPEIRAFLQAKGIISTYDEMLTHARCWETVNVSQQIEKNKQTEGKSVLELASPGSFSEKVNAVSTESTPRMEEVENPLAKYIPEEILAGNNVPTTRNEQIDTLRAMPIGQVQAENPAQELTNYINKNLRQLVRKEMNSVQKGINFSNGRSREKCPVCLKPGHPRERCFWIVSSPEAEQWRQRQHALGKAPAGIDRPQPYRQNQQSQPPSQNNFQSQNGQRNNGFRHRNNNNQPRPRNQDGNNQNNNQRFRSQSQGPVQGN